MSIVTEGLGDPGALLLAEGYADGDTTDERDIVPSGEVISVYTIDAETGVGSGGAIGTSESILEGATGYNVVVNWGSFPGTDFKAGLSGRFTTGANPVTLRVRAGGRPTTNNSSTEITGTIVYQVTLPALTVTDLGQVGSFFPKPSGSLVYSNLAVTAQAVGSSSTLASTAMVMTIQPDSTGLGQGVALSSGRGSSGTALEQVVAGVGYEWIVNFDQFVNASSLLFAFAVYSDPPFGGNQLTVRIRVGGSDYTIDGTAALTVVDDNSAQTRERIIAGSATVTNTFTGPQLVKMTWEGRAGPGHPVLFIIES